VGDPPFSWDVVPACFFDPPSLWFDPPAASAAARARVFVKKRKGIRDGRATASVGAGRSRKRDRARKWTKKGVRDVFGSRPLG